MKDRDGIRIFIGVSSLLIAIVIIVTFGRNGFRELSQILIDKQKVDYVGYYAIDKDEYCAVAEIKQNGEFSLFTTQNFAWAQGKYYMESEFKMVSLREGEIKIYDSLFRFPVVEFSGDEEKVMRLKYTLGTSNYDELYHAVSREEYISLFAKVSDRLYERYDEIGDRLPEIEKAAALEQEDPAAELEQEQENLAVEPEQEQENPAATAGQENERDKYTDEEWFLATVKVGGLDMPHGFTREDTMWDSVAYIDAGGRYYNYLAGAIVKYLRLWAEEKEKAEGEGYWADGHIERIDEARDVVPVLNQNLLLLNPKAVVRYVEEVMDSSLWEELRSYVGDERADEIDQELYELIQNEKDIFARMAEQN